MLQLSGFYCGSLPPTDLQLGATSMESRRGPFEEALFEEAALRSHGLERMMSPLFQQVFQCAVVVTP